MTRTYDFVIIGAGSAGCVMADRLTANERFNVLLIEAGGHDTRAWIKIPLGYGYTFSNPVVNWRYSAAPDPELKFRKGYWPRGKVIGGSSSINAMAYVRGLPHDFDNWSAAGATGWNWETVRTWYDALERHEEWDEHGHRRLRGTGPVHVSDLSRQMHPFSRHFLAAAREMDWAVLKDMNAAPRHGENRVAGEGLGYMRGTVRNGVRWSSADAFLRTAKRRKNLTVISKSLVERILFQGARATGVRFRRKGVAQEVSVSREIIVSAGAVNSPQLLQLSGVGPSNLLKKHGIDVVRNLPQVGKGLQDHLAITHTFTANTDTLNAQIGRPVGQLRAGLRYVARRRGPLSVPINQCSGFVRSDGADVPDIQIYCNPISYRTSECGRPKIDRDNGFALSAQPCRPTSIGEVVIRSKDPQEPPAIFPNSLSTQEDRQMAVQAGRVLQALASTQAMKQVTHNCQMPECLTMDDDMLLENFRARASTVFHPTCTCRMGNDASDSVLDARLRVHGVVGLRVIDASAFPNITSGNTNAPTMMLAARAAQLVLDDTASQACAAQ